MDVKVNQIPALTWNWLRMNELTVKEVKALQGESSVSYSTPAGIVEKSNQDFTIDTKTGMGENMEKLLKESAVLVHSFETSDKVQEVLKLDYKFDGNATANAVELKVADNAEMTVFMDFRSEEEAGDAAIETRYEIGENAHLTLIQVQYLGDKFRFYNNIGGEHAENGKFTLIQLVLKGDQSYYGNYSGLHAKKSELETKIAYMLKDENFLDMNYDADHTGKKSLCDIQVSGVLRNQSRKLFRGTIDFHRGCAGAVGAEMEDVLLMDESVRNQTIPIILCDEEDVSGTHGASIGRLDEGMMFYMQSRGIKEEAIYEMMAKAKIEAIANQIPQEEIREEVRQLLEK
ncbi:MAG: SufD family Fe-S cluster assembly protein [Lachnospiraceae bacterium]|nr:SufD family Fe-S cluster assembly protein [Lachnospiraceae bacterium]